MSERLTTFAQQVADEEIQSLRAENKRLRLAIRRLAEQDATLSVCDGNVTVTMDGTLTDAEREAVEFAVAHGETVDAAWRYTLRGLLERLGGGR